MNTFETLMLPWALCWRSGSRGARVNEAVGCMSRGCMYAAQKTVSSGHSVTVEDSKVNVGVACSMGGWGTWLAVVPHLQAMVQALTQAAHEPRTACHRCRTQCACTQLPMLAHILRNMKLPETTGGFRQEGAYVLCTCWHCALSRTTPCITSEDQHVALAHRSTHGCSSAASMLKARHDTSC